ncbi:MAG TPA: 2Fe-2S iron-sulfur cluster-binding protein [Methylibium sp.]|nr:2Fe-2S iron-sulfur cluster-binding protein [Methylibium sp.]
MSTASFTVRIAGGDSRYTVAAGDNLLRAGLRAGIGLPYECNAGGCGSCKFEALGGEFEELWPEAPGLSAKERGRGRRLACQCRPLSDCEIKIRPAAGFVPAIPPQRFAAEYLGQREVTADIGEFRFRGPGPARFEPGQYALLELPGAGQLRAYSMSNQPNDDGDWCFMVRRVPQGRVSPRLFDALRPGERVGIDGPLGLAQWRPEPARDVVCIAGGSGLAPMVSIVNAATAAPSADGRGVWLFYGGRGPADMPRWADWLQSPAQVRLASAVSDHEATDRHGWTGERGFVHELARRHLADEAGGREYYLAGPPPMIEAAVRMLMTDLQVPASQIHYDRFF